MSFFHYTWRAPRLRTYFMFFCLFSRLAFLDFFFFAVPLFILLRLYLYFNMRGRWTAIIVDCSITTVLLCDTFRTAVLIRVCCTFLWHGTCVSNMTIPLSPIFVRIEVLSRSMPRNIMCCEKPSGVVYA